MGLNKGKLLNKGKPRTAKDTLEGTRARPNDSGSRGHLLTEVVGKGEAGAHVLIGINEQQRNTLAIKLKRPNIITKKEFPFGEGGALTNKPSHNIGLIGTKIKDKTVRSEHSTGNVHDVNTLIRKGASGGNNRNNDIIAIINIH